MGCGRASRAWLGVTPIVDPPRWRAPARVLGLRRLAASAAARRRHWAGVVPLCTLNVSLVDRIVKDWGLTLMLVPSVAHRGPDTDEERSRRRVITSTVARRRSSPDMPVAEDGGRMRGQWCFFFALSAALPLRIIAVARCRSSLESISMEEEGGWGMAWWRTFACCSLAATTLR
eukprot:CAMPEP_0194676280 /NCGR_PEP_ID=MMETSP0295-20121207/8778_1 /TAXON_ID=39354 /ORGANISM="Heterosigma akashiwo, Strain CCMP2393" /LENGTH=173 /DNA_ID=CAMNT_0039560813 /DNA_START=360 /DNA_END=881 /DNA_ORIENTATION=+